MIDNTYTLCVNSVEDFIQVTICNQGKIKTGIEAESNKKGIVLLPKMIEQCVNIAGIEMCDIKKIACVTGPGSFTGIRIGLSTLYGVAITRKIPMGGINYLELLAQNGFKWTSGNIFVVQYAKIDHLYVQGFSGPDPITSLTSPMVCSVKNIEKLLTKYPHVKVLGSGVRRYHEVFTRMGVNILSPVFDRPSLASLCEYASHISYHLKMPSPLYLRVSDAEENFEKIARQRGILS